jgi:hypothetical protein
VPGCWRYRPTGELDVRADGGQQPGPDTGHAIERLERTQRPPGLAISDDGLGQPLTHPGKPGELAGGGPVGVYPLAGAERTGQRQYAITMSQRGPGRERRQELDLSRCLSRASDPPAHALAGEPEAEEQQERAPFGG